MAKQKPAPPPEEKPQPKAAPPADTVNVTPTVVGLPATPTTMPLPYAFLNLDALEQLCPRCAGTGVTGARDDAGRATPYHEHCRDCRGTGLLPSEQGRRLIQFLATYFRPM